MTAYQVLLHELARHGQTTYKRLMRRYGDQGYSYEAFVAAVRKARQQGIVKYNSGRNKPIVAVGDCPCCGRKL